MSLREKLKENVSKNTQKLLAIVGDIAIGVISAILYGITASLTWTVILILIVFTVKPYIFNYINIVFKGEMEEFNQENIKLRKQLEYIREISEYRCVLAAKTGDIPEAVIATKDWNESNAQLQGS